MTCASGYVGTVTAAACQGANTAFGVSGCFNTCTAPSPTPAGYVVTANPSSLAISGWATTGFTGTCATNYSGTAAADVCTGTSRNYVLKGCTACPAGQYAAAGNGNSCAGVTCTTPTSTTGYTGTSKTETTLTSNGFTVTGWTCASGYSGTAADADLHHRLHR